MWVGRMVCRIRCVMLIRLGVDEPEGSSIHVCQVGRCEQVFHGWWAEGAIRGPLA